MTVNKDDWKDRYQKAKTWGDGERLVDELSTEEKQILLKALVIAHDYVGVSMRDEFIMGVIGARLQSIPQ